MAATPRFTFTSFRLVGPTDNRTTEIDRDTGITDGMRTLIDRNTKLLELAHERVTGGHNPKASH